MEDYDALPRQRSRRRCKAMPAAMVRQSLSRCISAPTLTDTRIHGKQASKGAGGSLWRSDCHETFFQNLCTATVHLDRGADHAGHRILDGARSGDGSSADGKVVSMRMKIRACESGFAIRLRRRPFLSRRSSSAARAWPQAAWRSWLTKSRSRFCRQFQCGRMLR
jgi:hypothetical protein